MTENEFNLLEEKYMALDKDFCATVQRFLLHPAVYHGMDSATTRRLIYPIIFSEKTDKEIIAELDKLAPPGKTYM